MGIMKQALKMIIHENRHRKIEGDYLSIGKQTVHCTRETLKNYFPRDFHEDLLSAANQDHGTRHGFGGIYDHELIHLVNPECRYHCLDVSDYEGAEIIHDLNIPIPERLQLRFDFIFDGSAIDNVFDPAQFIRNTSAMLRPHGRIVHLVHGSLYPGAYLMFSPEWFFNYYAANNFLDVKIYFLTIRNQAQDWHEPKADYFHYTPRFTRKDDYDRFLAGRHLNGIAILMVLAEKGTNQQIVTNPMQMQYLPRDSYEALCNKYDEYSAGDRPLLRPEYCLSANVAMPLLTDHYIYLGSDYNVL